MSVSIFVGASINTSKAEKISRFCCQEKCVHRAAIRNSSLEHLTTWMQNRGVSQSDLAKQLGISQPTLSRYLKGQTTPNVKTANKIAVLTKGAIAPSLWNGHGDLMETLNDC